jgi:hypothetical protein
MAQQRELVQRRAGDDGDAMRPLPTHAQGFVLPLPTHAQLRTWCVDPVATRVRTERAEPRPRWRAGGQALPLLPSAADLGPLNIAVSIILLQQMACLGLLC